MRTSWSSLLENFYINISLTGCKVPNSAHLSLDRGRTPSSPCSLLCLCFCLRDSSFLCLWAFHFPGKSAGVSSTAQRGHCFQWLPEWWERLREPLAVLPRQPLLDDTGSENSLSYCCNEDNFNLVGYAQISCYDWVPLRRDESALETRPTTGVLALFRDKGHCGMGDWEEWVGKSFQDGVLAGGSWGEQVGVL